MRLNLRLRVLSLTLVMMMGGVLVAADDPHLVIRLQAPETTLKEASKFVDDIQPGYGGLVGGQGGMLGIGISNPTLQGVDNTRDWYAAVYLQKKGKPLTVFVIPATDTASMQEALGKKFTFFADGDYGIYSESSAAIEKFKTRAGTGVEKLVTGSVSEPVKQVMTNGHLALGVNLVSLKETYSAELLEAREKLLEGIKKAQQEMPEVPGVKLDWLPGFMDGFANHVQVAVEDSEAYVVSLTLAESGLKVQDLLQFADGSRASKFLAKYPPDRLAALNKLPAGQIGYGAFSQSIAQLNLLAMKLVPQMLNLNEEQQAGWKEAEKLISSVKFGSSSGSFGLGDLENGLIRSVSVTEVNPSSKVREISEKVVSVMNGLEFPGVKQEMTLEKDYETVDGVKVDLLVTRQVLEEEAEYGGLQAQINQILYGGDGPEARIAYLEGAVLQAVGGGTEGLQSALAAFKAGAAGTDSIIARDTAALGGTNNLVGLFDLQTFIVEGLKIAVSSPALPSMPFDEDSLEDLDIERAYIGLSRSTSNNVTTSTLHIPKQTIGSGLQLFFFFQSARSGSDSGAF